jgi:hypothetical protein
MKQKTRAILESANEQAKQENGSPLPIKTNEIPIHLYRASDPDHPVYVLVHKDDLGTAWWERTLKTLAVVKTVVLENGSSE